MKSKSINFSASNTKHSVKFATVNENSLHAALLIITIVCLLFERIANNLVDTQVHSLFVAFICQCFIR